VDTPHSDSIGPRAANQRGKSGTDARSSYETQVQRPTSGYTLVGLFISLTLPDRRSSSIETRPLKGLGCEDYGQKLSVLVERDSGKPFSPVKDFGPAMTYVTGPFRSPPNGCRFGGTFLY